MKLVRFGAPGREKPGMLDAQGRHRDLSAIIPDINAQFLSGGLAALGTVDAASPRATRGRG